MRTFVAGAMLRRFLANTWAWLGGSREWHASSESCRYACITGLLQLVAIDPGHRRGRVIVEFHGFHNESIISRMHIELTRSGSRHWYDYWIDQFDHIWQAPNPSRRTRSLVP